MDAQTFTLETLERASGVQARTLRHWIKHKLLPRPNGTGRGTRYDARHLTRARAARQLRAQGLSLRDIRARIENLSDAQLAAIAQPTRPTTPEGLPAPPPPPAYPAETWEVVPLFDGLVLMVNSAKGPGLRRIASEIYRYYNAGVVTVPAE